MTQQTQISNDAKSLSGDSLSADRTKAASAGVLAIVFGVFMLYAAGFANSETLHNAAHDGRHSFIFPCH